MPLYDCKCTKCGEVVEQYMKHDEEPDICACGGDSERIISSSYYINRDIDYVTDNISGEPIRVNSRKHLRELEKEHGVTQKIGKGWY